MKYLQYILCLVLLISGCTTTAVQHTIYQQKIEQKREKLTDDAKDFLVKATQMLQVNSGTIDINRVKSLLEKSQSLLGVDADDGKELKDLHGKELDKEIDKIIDESEEEKEAIADLRKKDEAAIAEMITNNIKTQTIKEYERGKTFKLYAICATILSILGALFYFFPTKFLSIGSSIISFFFKK
jgi:DNA-binding ferritin-like protein (Dps family)